MAKTWSGLLAPVEKPTGDGRMFASGGITNRDLPLPLRFQRADVQGHSGAVVVGRILKIDYRDKDGIWGSGDWLNPEITPEVTEAQELSAKGVIGPSVDLDDATLERVPVTEEAAQELAKAGEDCGCESGVTHAEEGPMLSVVTAGRISGATLVQITAFAETKALSLDDDEAEEMTASANVWTAALSVGDPVQIEADKADESDQHGYFVEFTEEDDEEYASVVYDDGSYAVIPAWRVTPATGREAAAWTEALVAAATKVSPPKSWFADPELEELTGVTITEDGQVFGHLADWHTCHIGFANSCELAPRSETDYAYFHTGAVETAEGDVLPVGRVTLGTGHAGLDLGFASAAEHYDNTGAAVAVVRAGEDKYGIWIAGALVPEATPERVAEFRRSPLSGDWRRVGRNLELVAALAVNTPGFPITRSRVASGHPMALVAAGVPHEVLYFADLSMEARMKAAKMGHALQDGSYPIRNVAELQDAVQAYGRAKDKAATRALIMRRAR